MGKGVQSRQTGWRALSLAIAAAWALAAPATAQDFPQADPWSTIIIGAPIVTEELRPAIDANAAEPVLSAEDMAIIDKALEKGLALDPASLINAPVKPLRLPSDRIGKSLDLTRTNRPDGSGTVTVKKPLATEWEANIGADLGLAANTSSASDNAIIYSPDNPLGILRSDRNSGAAFASVGVNKFASVDARLDPNADQGRIATTFKRSLPVGDTLSVSVQSRMSLTESLGTPQAASSDIPLRIAPVNDPAAPVARVWGNENVAKLDILPTGTTLGAGLSATSTDPVTHNTLSAEQKIYGPLAVATTVTDIGRTSESKSLSARFKLTW